MTLGQRIREIVGPCSNSSGRGMTWLYVGEGRGSEAKNKKLIKQLQSGFETWKMVRHCEHRCPASYPGMDYGMPEGTLISEWVATDYHFVVKSKSGKYLGMCQVSGDYSKDSYLIINTEKRSEEEIQKYNRGYQDVYSYEKI